MPHRNRKIEEKELITINPREMTAFVEEGGKFLFKPSAEEAIIKLHETIVMLQALEDQIKERIADMGVALNPNFKGVKGDKVSCIYRKYGAKYKYDWKLKEQAKPYLIEKVSYTVDTEKVDKYLEAVKELPGGILEAPRESVLSIVYEES